MGHRNGGEAASQPGGCLFGGGSITGFVNGKWVVVFESRHNSSKKVHCFKFSAQLVCFHRSDGASKDELVACLLVHPAVHIEDLLDMFVDVSQGQAGAILHVAEWKAEIRWE